MRSVLQLVAFLAVTAAAAYLVYEALVARGNPVTRLLRVMFVVFVLVSATLFARPYLLVEEVGEVSYYAPHTVYRNGTTTVVIALVRQPMLKPAPYGDAVALYALVVAAIGVLLLVKLSFDVLGRAW